MQKKSLTLEQAVQKLRKYCNYQERCHIEVKQKLREFKIHSSFQDEIITSLIEEGYLNEERFARMYAGGKFRIKCWGKRKIIASLKQKDISEYCIKKALEQIDPGKYYIVLEALALRKFHSLNHENGYEKKKKTIKYLLQKGYEAEMVAATIDRITS